LHVLDSDFSLYDERAGMNVVSVRAGDIDLGPVLPGLRFHGEFARELGDGPDGAIDAHAWYAELAYTFEDLPWTPTISYRYAEFSGDKDPDDDTSEAFDPLFYEGDEERDWGTWIQGEVTGNYFLFNSNQKNHMVHVTVSPSDSLSAGVIYYNFSLYEKHYYGVPLHDLDFMQEVDLHMDWAINDNLYLSAAYGFAVPGPAARELFGNDDPMHTTEVAAYVYF
jgi:hypothetical protein